MLSVIPPKAENVNAFFDSDSKSAAEVVMR